MTRILLTTLLLVACTDEPSTIATLQRSGYTEIRATGYAPFARSDDDTFATGFTALNPLGQRVHGVVCCGVFKGCTVRF